MSDTTAPSAPDAGARPPFGDHMYVTDAGLETWLVFHRGIDLPAFAAYPLVDEPAGKAHLVEYFEQFAAIAAATGSGLLLETPTWRSNPEWGASLGHDLDELGRLVDASVELVDRVVERWSDGRPALVSGSVGPRGDGYVLGGTMTADEAAAYHRFQIDRMAAAGVDLVSALTIGYADEAIGVTQAAAGAGVPSVISFTVDTDGRLPSGQPLAEAIEQTDAGGAAPAHYMVNCAHPTHFAEVLDGAWLGRIGGIRANASALSHAELDAMETLDAGDPLDLAEHYRMLLGRLPALRVVGGCCGTDARHVAAIARACTAMR